MPEVIGARRQQIRAWLLESAQVKERLSRESADLLIEAAEVLARCLRSSGKVLRYTQLQQPRAADEGMLRRILCGLSCRDYRAAAEAVPEAFGLSRSSVSRRYIRATARKLATLQERRLGGYEVVALVLDGKRFAEDTMVIALGITLRGEKVLLGFVQTGTESATAGAAFLRGLVDRGLQSADGVLVVLDGGKGVRRVRCRMSSAPRRRCSDAPGISVRVSLRTSEAPAAGVAREAAARVSPTHVRRRAGCVAPPPRGVAPAQ